MPVGNPLDVDEDHPRGRVIPPRLQQVNLAHVRLVAQADEFGKADAPGHRHVQHGRAQRPRLRHKGDRAARRYASGKGRVERGVGIDHAQAIGTDEAQVVLAGDLDQFPLPLQPLAPSLAEPSADDHDGWNGLLSALFQHGWHKAVGDDDHRQVYGIGNL